MRCRRGDLKCSNNINKAATVTVILMNVFVNCQG